MPTGQPSNKPSSQYVKQQSPGLIYRIYNGYHNEVANYTTSASARTGYSGTSNGTSIDISNLASATHRNVIGNNGSVMFSIEWIGYFYTGSESGIWTFYTNSDDGSYLWLGSTALDGYTIGNSLVNNGGSHPPLLVSGTIELSANTYYPIRILYGQGSSSYEMTMYFESPNGVTHYDGTGFYSKIFIPGIKCCIYFPFFLLRYVLS